MVAMTRINCIPVEQLTSKHLIAEYRELPRIFRLVLNAQMSGKSTIIPNAYTLGTGHVRFFYNKLVWVERRFTMLCGEMLLRGYSPKYLSIPDFADQIDPVWWNDWQPSLSDQAINWSRIRERLRILG